MKRSKHKSKHDAKSLVQPKPDRELVILEYLTALAAMNGQIPGALKAILKYTSELARDLRKGITHDFVPATFPDLVRWTGSDRSRRWTCKIAYRTHAGLLEAEYHIEELSELHELIEQGPNWYAIDRIEISISTPSTMTIEQSLVI